ncbi:MAG: rRNA maturation RNase YbeY [Candidatus Acidiferrales bacterium]
MVFNRQHRIRIEPKPLRAFAARLARALRLRKDSFAVALVGDNEIAALNRRYRGKAKPTDVLSFPASNGNKRGGYRGDVVISVETARRNARRFGHSAGEEIKLLTLHGVLHLLGYDHETDQGQMARRELRLRRRLGLE